MMQTWILVADGSHARLFQTAGTTEPWRLARKLDREHSREKTDRSDSHEDRGERDFAQLVVGELETQRQAGGFERLVLVAPPKFLGQLRGELKAPLETCVVRSHDADYTQMPDADLVKHVDIT
ncbi:MAG: host attachment protein [Myxococcota bacterium]|nr:host attachment protein [Myxococcota bacterium]